MNNTIINKTFLLFPILDKFQWIYFNDAEYRIFRSYIFMSAIISAVFSLTFHSCTVEKGSMFQWDAAGSHGTERHYMSCIIISQYLSLWRHSFIVVHCGRTGRDRGRQRRYVISHYYTHWQYSWFSNFSLQMFYFSSRRLVTSFLHPKIST